MGRGSENLYTTWIPFGDNPPEMGSLCMLHQSNQLGVESTYALNGLFSPTRITKSRKFTFENLPMDIRNYNKILFHFEKYFSSLSKTRRMLLTFYLSM